MPEVDYVVLSEWFDWITTNISIPVDLIGENAHTAETQAHMYDCDNYQKYSSLSVFVAFLTDINEIIVNTIK